MLFHRRTLSPLLLGLIVVPASAQDASPEDTEVWRPVPSAISTGPAISASVPPSDAIVLFDGTNLDEWVNSRDASPAGWRMVDGTLVVNKAAGDIETRRAFRDFQLHIEWRVPEEISGSGQSRGNSGVFLATPGSGYELQILDSYQNETYVNGMAGSIYKQSIPLVNASRRPGEWQSYDVIWTAPSFTAEGDLHAPARVTVLFNGVLVQNDFALLGETKYIGAPEYTPYESSPIMLQAHGDPSEPISFRNIWVRDLS